MEDKTDRNVPEHIKERRAIKDALAKECNYNVHQFAEMIKLEEKKDFAKHSGNHIFHRE